MKNIHFFIITLIGLISNTLHAQNDNNKILSFGAKAGVNYSNVWDSESQEFEANGRIGFVGGVFVGISLNKYIGLQPEILFSQKGFKGSGTLLSTSYSFSRTTNYIDIPLQLQVKPTEFLTVVVGPQFSFLLSQNDNYTFGGNSVDQSQEFKNENLRRNILGFVGGGDVYYQNFVFSARAGFDFQANKGDGTSSTPRYKNQWLQLTVGFRI
jgi:hypothetical protein